MCHRYADCHRSFDGRPDEDSAACRCVAGFAGDGVGECRDLSREEQDCRGTDSCHPDASCSFSEERQFFACACNMGFEGDGFNCRVKQGIIFRWN